MYDVGRLVAVEMYQQRKYQQDVVFALNNKLNIYPPRWHSLDISNVPYDVYVSFTHGASGGRAAASDVVYSSQAHVAALCGEIIQQIDEDKGTQEIPLDSQEVGVV